MTVNAYTIMQILQRIIAHKMEMVEVIKRAETSAPETLRVSAEGESENKGAAEVMGAHGDKGDLMFELADLYLVKWKNIEYEDATWELFPETIQDEKLIRQFEERNIVQDLGKEILPSGKTCNLPLEAFNLKSNMTLRSYQVEGVNWLLTQWQHKRPAILGDEMGLGKTIQTVTVVNFLKTQMHVRQPILIVTPLSTMHQWHDEFLANTSLNLIVFQGSHDSRELISEYEFFYPDSTRSNVAKFDVLITTYEVLLREVERLRKFTWSVVVTDEGHRLKNPNGSSYKALTSLKRQHSILLSGNVYVYTYSLTHV